MEQSLSERFLSVRRRIIDDFFIQMNPMQRQAVYAVDGPVLILAGAGQRKDDRNHQPHCKYDSIWRRIYKCTCSGAFDRG